MVRQDWLDSEGGDRWFQTTQWSQIRGLPQADQSVRDRLLNSLMQRYWSPVFWYIRAKRIPRDQAKDLTQDFFHEIVLNRGLFEKADQSKGRLRNLLLVALNRYLTSVYRKDSAQKRGPQAKVMSLDQQDFPDPATEDDPEQAYYRGWAAALLDRTLAELCDVCYEAGEAHLWGLFSDCIINPILYNSPRPSFKILCERYDIASESKASNLVTTVKRRFRAILHRNLRESVDSDQEMDRELTDLLKYLGR